MRLAELAYLYGVEMPEEAERDEPSDTEVDVDDPDFETNGKQEDDMAEQNFTLDGEGREDGSAPVKVKLDPKDPLRPRRKKARRACFACQRAHLTCGMY